MKPFLIGCSVIFVLGVVAVVLIGVFFVGNVKDMVSEFEESGDLFDRLEEDHPFEPPEDWVIDPERFSVYLACRTDVAEMVRRAIDSFNEEPGWKKPVKGMAMIPDVVQKTAVILDAHKMPLTEYFWHDREVLLVVEKAAASPDDPERREEWVRMADEFSRGFTSEEGFAKWQVRGEKNFEFDSSHAPESQRLDPLRVIVPDGNTELVWENRQVLLDTADVARMARMFSF